MNKKTIIIVAVLTLLAIVGVYSLGRKWNGSEIQKLYGQKWLIVTQKAELLRQDLDIRNQIDELNKQILVIDESLTKLINPQQTGFIQENQLTPIQQVDNYLTLSWH